jgi:hypothetical protein
VCTSKASKLSKKPVVDGLVNCQRSSDGLFNCQRSGRRRLEILGVKKGIGALERLHEPAKNGRDVIICTFVLVKTSVFVFSY